MALIFIGINWHAPFFIFYFARVFTEHMQASTFQLLLVLVSINLLLGLLILWTLMSWHSWFLLALL